MFNRKAQNFRLQKKAPSLILAKKEGNLTLPTPPGYGIGGERNYYFSHMLNCIYDCRYCFLQGMYRSAHYVIFVNFDDFQHAIEEKIQEMPNEELYFFSGYDCDSLALEPVTHFIEQFLPFFAKHPKAHLELRTKSIQTRFLEKQPPLPNVIAAYTLSPETVQQEYEKKTPSLSARLKKLAQLQQLGWPIGLRFDPVLFVPPFKETYRTFFETVFSIIDPTRVHSASLGAFRVPKELYKNMTALYPEEKLFARGIQMAPDSASYHTDLEQEMLAFCQQEILKHLPKSKLFVCS